MNRWGWFPSRVVSNMESGPSTVPGESAFRQRAPEFAGTGHVCVLMLNHIESWISWIANLDLCSTVASAPRRSTICRANRRPNADDRFRSKADTLAAVNKHECDRDQISPAWFVTVVAHFANLRQVANPTHTRFTGVTGTPVSKKLLKFPKSSFSASGMIVSLMTALCGDSVCVPDECRQPGTRFH